MEKRFFDRDPLTGAVEMFYFDHATDDWHIQRTEDVTAHIEFTQEVAKDNSGWKGDLHHVASIPMTVVQELAKTGIITAGGRILDDERMRRWLNDRDNRVFRTKLGKI